MKKMRAIATTALVALLVCLCLLCTGCYGSVEGTYKFKKATIDGETYKVGDTYSSGGLISVNITLDENYCTAVINEDGSIAIAGAVTQVGTWAEAGTGKIKVTTLLDEHEYKCNGKTLKIEYNGNEYVLEKVEE